MVGRPPRGIALALGAWLSSCGLPARPVLLEGGRDASSNDTGASHDASLDGTDVGADREAVEREVSIPSSPDGESGVGDAPADRSADAEGGASPDAGAPPDAFPRDTGVDAVDGGADAPPEIGRPDAASPCVVSISAGMWHTCAVLRDGVHCWGYDSEGELGDGETPVTSRPGVNATPALGGAKAVSAGGMHTCALTRTGGVRCWGQNGSGQLGFPTDASSAQLSPPTNDVLGNVQAIAAGYDHTCALTVPGGVRCWGNNVDGQVGIGSASIMTQPTPPTSDAIGGIQAVATGYGHTCALTTSGGVRCWGLNGNGQLGIGSMATAVLYAPPATDALAGAVAISAGYAHTCAVMAGGGVRCWGYNMYGQLGDGTTNDLVAPPAATSVLAGVPVATVGAGYAHTCALTVAGAVYCWGSNASGQLGQDPNVVNQQPTPAPIALGTTAVALTVGDSYSCVLTVGGTILCWGTNNNGQFGDGTISSAHPTPAAASLETVCGP